MSDPEREPATFSASLKVGKRRPGFSLSGDAARALTAAMFLCTLIVGAEVPAGIAWLIVRAV